MNIVLDNSFNDSYICEIEENSGIIRWQYEKNNRPDYVLIVQTPFFMAVDINEVIKTIKATNTDIVVDEVVSVTSNTSCKLATVSQGSRGVYSVGVMPATYSVYGCKMNNDELVVFEEKNKNHNSCKVSAIIEYKVEDHPISISEGRFFRKTEVKYNFSKITVFQNKSYTDGVLYYTFDDCGIKFPIGRQMLDTPFYVKWYNNSKPPIIRADYDGFKCRKR